MKNKLAGILTSVVLLISYLPSHAQVLETKKDTSSGIIVKTNLPKPKKKKQYHEVLKLNPLLIVSGEIPVYLESRLNKGLSLELGIGVTTNDPSYYLLNVPNNQNAIDLYDSSRSTLGFTFKSDIRYYVDRDFPEGLFFGAGINFKQYNSKFNYTNVSAGQGQPAIQSFSLKRQYTDFLLMVGDQEDLGSDFYGEVYGGVGLRLKNVENAQQVKDSSGVLVYAPVGKTTNSALLSLGLKIGFAF
jgi:hypothetical protein